MAQLRKELTFKIVTNLESVQTQIELLATRLTRIQHLMKEVNAGLVEIENDIKECNVVVKLIQIEGEQENASNKQAMDQKEE